MRVHASKTPASKNINKPRLATDMSLWLLLGLALLSIPRVVVHDLEAVSFDSLVYKALAIVPLLIYLGVALFRKNKRPLYDFVVMGLLFGFFLALTHQVFWNAAFGDNPPRLGDNLEGQLSPATEEVLMRIATFISSIVTGVVTGLIFGVVALIAKKVRGRS